jgi:hypothetical protein
MNYNFNLLTIRLLVVIDVLFLIRSIVLREPAFITATLLLLLLTIARILTYNIANNSNP